MGSRSKEVRKELTRGGAFGRSSNQGVIKYALEQRGRTGYNAPKSKKVSRSATNKSAAVASVQKEIDFQFARALGKVDEVDGNGANLEDLDCIDSFGRKEDEFITPKGNRVTITIVDFTREDIKEDAKAA